MLVVAVLSLSGMGQTFMLPIQTLLEKERNPLDLAFRGLVRPREMKTENIKNVGYSLPRDNRLAYTSLMLKGEIEIVL